MLPSVTNGSARKPRAFDEYVTFCALGGMLTDDDGNIKTLSVNRFCEIYDVSRMSLSRWKRETPNFVELVEKRRDAIAPQARVTNALNKLYLIGVGSLGPNAIHRDQRAAVDALKTFLGHHGRLKLPTQPHEIDVGNNLMELAMSARRKNLIEGEVVERANDAGVGVATPDGVSETAA